MSNLAPAALLPQLPEVLVKAEDDKVPVKAEDDSQEGIKMG